MCQILARENKIDIIAGINRNRTGSPLCDARCGIDQRIVFQIVEVGLDIRKGDGEIPIPIELLISGGIGGGGHPLVHRDDQLSEILITGGVDCGQREDVCPVNQVGAFEHDIVRIIAYAHRRDISLIAP